MQALLNDYGANSSKLNALLVESAYKFLEEPTGTSSGGAPAEEYSAEKAKDYAPILDKALKADAIPDESRATVQAILNDYGEISSKLNALLVETAYKFLVEEPNGANVDSAPAQEHAAEKAAEPLGKRRKKDRRRS